MPWKKLCLLVTLIIAPAARADIVVFNSQSAFQAALTSFYLEPFTVLQPVGSSIHFSGNGYSYTASTASAVGYAWVGGSNVLTVGNASDSLTFSNFGGSPFAFGGNFFFDNNLGGTDPTSSGMLQVSNGIDPDVFQAITAPANASTFFGFLSTLGPITSITFTKTAGSGYVDVDNLIVGSVPEPSSVALLGVGLATLVVYRKRRS